MRGGGCEAGRAAAWASAGALAALAAVALAALSAGTAWVEEPAGRPAEVPEKGHAAESAGHAAAEPDSAGQGSGGGPDVVMPSKSSRPGCEEDDACYIPAAVEVSAGGSVTWRNDDVAFHTVTSGAYGSPDGAFDSGHMDPGEEFTVSFGKAGSVAYHCTLHPWMRGVVAVLPAAGAGGGSGGP